MARQERRRDAGKERFWRSVVARWRRGQPATVREFCAEHGLAEQSFYWWRRTLTQRDRYAHPGAASKPCHREGHRPTDEQPTARFVSVRIVPPVGTAAADVHVLLRSGHILRVPAGFDAATLRQLLVILQEERPC